MQEAQARDAVVRRDAVTRRLLAGADAVAAVLAVGVLLAVSGHDASQPAALLIAPIVVAINKIAGLYDRDDLVMRRSTLDEIPALLQVTSMFALLVAAIAGELLGFRPGPQQLVVFWLAAAALITAARMLARVMATSLTEPERCLVVGDAELLPQVKNKLEQLRHRAAVVADVEINRSRGRSCGPIEDLPALISANNVDRVIFAPVYQDCGDTVELVRVAKAAGVRVSIVPRVLEAVGTAVQFEQVDGMTMLGVRRFGLSRSSQALKRCFDLAVGLVTLLAIAPVLAAIAVLIRLDSPGPVFFRQTRIGRDGEPFDIWKFRSMRPDAESLKATLVDRNEASGGLFKVTDDPRVTRVGRMLRRTSLDELPQIFNVMTGDMSLVGPRPLVVDEDALVQGIYRSRLHLTPGMTGPWQILGATRVPLEEMVGMDYLYVANWSLWEDVKILLRTVPHVLGRRGL